MGLQDFRKGREEAAGATRGSTGMGQLNAFIDQGSEFSGRLCFRDTVRIDGKFEGEITSENTLIIGETGEIRATIHSETVVISGTFEGDVVASNQVVVHGSAKVSGHVQTGSLVVEEGAQLNAQVTMGSEAAVKEDKKKPTNGLDKAKEDAQPAGS